MKVILSFHQSENIYQRLSDIFFWFVLLDRKTLIANGSVNVQKIVTCKIFSNILRSAIKFISSLDNVSFTSGRARKICCGFRDAKISAALRFKCRHKYIRTAKHLWGVTSLLINSVSWDERTLTALSEYLETYIERERALSITFSG